MDSLFCCVNLLLNTTNKFSFDNLFFFHLYNSICLFYIFSIFCLACYPQFLKDTCYSLNIVPPAQINEFEMLNIYADVMLLAGGALGRRSIRESRASWAESVILYTRLHGVPWSLLSALWCHSWEVSSYEIGGRFSPDTESATTMI